MVGKILGGAITFFAACMLIYYGAILIASVWHILVIIGAIAFIVYIIWQIRENRPRW